MRRERDDTDADKTRKSVSDDHALIRELYLEGRSHYSFAEARRLACMSEAELDAAIAEGMVAPETFKGETVLTWDDVAALALTRWTPRMIAAALGDAGEIPELNQMRQIEVVLPLYQVRLLHHLAETMRGSYWRELTASDVLEMMLEASASAVDITELEAAITGIRDALRYPYFIRRVSGQDTCSYCGRLSEVARRTLCEACRARHHGQDASTALDHMHDAREETDEHRGTIPTYDEAKDNG